MFLAWQWDSKPVTSCTPAQNCFFLSDQWLCWQSQIHAVLHLPTLLWTVSEYQSKKSYIKPVHTWSGCNKMEEAGACAVLSQQGKSRLEAEDMLIIKFFVTFCALLNSYCCQCTLMTEAGTCVNGTKNSFSYAFE